MGLTHKDKKLLWELVVRAETDPEAKKIIDELKNEAKRQVRAGQL